VAAIIAATSFCQSLPVSSISVHDPESCNIKLSLHMLLIDNIMVSDDLYLVSFLCPLQKCLGACCVQGDAGAPLEEEEISMLEDYLEAIMEFMTPEGIETVKSGGVFDYDIEGAYVTPLIRHGDCAFINYRNGIARCSIEKAYEEGQIPFRKPVSCHLYPVRLSKVGAREAVNYHHWKICDPALAEGHAKSLPLYVFLKDALVRKYGDAWYARLEGEIDKITKRRDRR
jgi:Fe-S-cluster containining protein